MNRLAVPSVAALFLVASGCRFRTTAGAPHESIGVVESRIESSGLQSLEVRVGIGAITLKEGTTPALQIAAEVGYRGGSKKLGRPAEFAKDVKVELDKARAVISDAHLGMADADDWKVDLTITAPAGLSLDLDCAVGSCNTSLAAGNVNAHVAVGDLVVAGRMLGDVEAKVGTGDARVAAKESIGNIKGDVAVGSIQIEVPSACGGEADLAVAVGSITVSGVPELIVEHQITSASARGKIGAGPAKLSVRVGTGGIRLLRK